MVIDAGKTFREAVMRFFPLHGITALSQLVLTHGHADAVFGLDDLRELQHVLPVQAPSDPADPASPLVRAYRLASPPVEILLHQATMDLVAAMFPYLVSAVPFLGPPRLLTTRTFVPVLRWRVVPPFSALALAGLPFHAFPVLHGPAYTALAFAIGRPLGTFVYISDVSAVPEPSLAFLRSISPIRHLVLDALSWQPHATHFSVQQALDLVDLLAPHRAYLTGLVSCNVGLHHDFERQIQQLRPNVFVAYDGQYFDLVLEDE